MLHHLQIKGWFRSHIHYNHVRKCYHDVCVYKKKFSWVGNIYLHMFVYTPIFMLCMPELLKWLIYGKN